MAHEDDPERAVRAAFGMQAAMAELNGDIKTRVRLRARAAGGGQHRRGARRAASATAYTVLGDAVNVAARLQAAAPAGGSLVGERTQRLTAREVVATASSSRWTLKGKAEPRRGMGGARSCTSRRAPVRAPALLGAAGRARRGARPPAGRCSSGSSREHAPHLVTVVGQAGVGKSRLLARARESDSIRARCPHQAAAGTLPGRSARASSTGP